MNANPSVKTSSAPALTQRDIAEKLGVSRQLVGFALSGQGRMSDEVRAQILQVAQENGYNQFSNQEARAMAARRNGKRAATGIVAVLFEPRFQGRPLSSVPFFMPFFEGVESEGIERGLDVLLCPLRPEGLPRLVKQGQVDGVISMVTDRAPAFLLHSSTVPIVYLQLAIKAPTPSETGASPVLCIEPAQGFALATRHLIELGHKRVGLFKFASYEKEHSPEARRNALAGYDEALREAGIPFDETLVDLSLESLTLEAGAAAMKRLLRKGKPNFTALVCHNDLMAMGAIRELENAGFRVPDDFSVMGFDDVAPHYAFTPALTSIHFSRQRMGRRAVELLCDLQSAANESTAPSREVFEVKLVKRDSTRALNSID